MAARVLMMPLAASSAGVGHLRRSAQVAGQMPGAALAVPASETVAAASALAELEIHSPLHDSARVSGDYEVVALDRRTTTLGEMLQWTGCGLGVGVDEGGPARRYLPLLLDTVPRPERHAPNAASLRWALAASAAAVAEKPNGDERSTWLVTFGGDDPAHLSEKVAASLLRVAAPHIEVVVVVGPRFGERHWPPGVSLRPPQASLAPLIAKAALVCTAYGLTAYEALAGGVPVLLANPSRYHQRLAGASGIPSLGAPAPWRRRHERRLASLVAHPERLYRPIAAVQRLLRSTAPQDRTQAELSSFLQSLEANGPRCCPSCATRLTPAVARFGDRTYRRCHRCRLIHMLRFRDDSAAISYDRSYFFEEYQQQYGRTYLEDFAHIREIGYQRLRRIARYGRSSGHTGSQPRLLDVGCAFGPFLDAARRRGWNAAGIDVSADAVAHVVDQLGLPAIEGNIEELSADDVVTALRNSDVECSGFDVVTMWYVIEHLVELRRVLLLARQLLGSGGVLAFSTPNASGISGRRSLREFLRQSPSDHYTIWNPRSAREVLRRHGYRVRAIRVTGHHPERFPQAAGPGLLRAAYRLLSVGVSRLLWLGDTFEVYATALPQKTAASERRRPWRRWERRGDV